MARSFRRAQAVARLRHPNLVRMLPLPGGAGFSPVLGNARRLADFTLPAGTFKRFDLEQVVRLLLDVLSGLAALHEVETDGRTFVHGQVSPQNIYIDEHGTARLVPLPIGTKPEDSGYTAPERLVGSNAVDARADVFSVGVMLWEALAGKRLFPNGLTQRSLDAELPSIQLSPDARWASPLCALAERATALEPALRFASALDFSNAMAAAAAQRLSNVDTDAWQEEAPTPVFQPNLHMPRLRASTPQPSVLSLAPSPEPADVAAPSVAPEARGAARRRSRAALLGFAALSLAAAGLLFAKSPRSWQRAAAAAPAVPAASVVQLPVAPAPAPTVAPAPEPAVAPESTVAPEPAVAPVSSVSAASPSLVASPAASPSLVAPPGAPASARPARSAPSPKQPARPRPHANDYGI